MKKCKCGNMVAGNARFCPHCGNRFTSRAVKMLAWVLVVFVGIPILIGMLLSSGSQNAPKAGSGGAGSASTRPGASESKWTYDTKEDRMRNKITHYAQLDSDNKLDFAFPYSGGSTGMIVLRNGPRGKDAMLMVDKGQFLCSVEGWCALKVKFDNGPITRYTGSQPSDGTSNALFIYGVLKLHVSSASVEEGDDRSRIFSGRV
jgi:hypothetical protein